MASSPPLDACETNRAEETHSVMETDDCPPALNGADAEKKDATKAEEEPDDVFKKPALFAAPSIASKRGNISAAPTRAPAERSHEKEKKAEDKKIHSDGEDKPTETCEEEEGGKEGDTKKVAAPVKPKPEARLRGPALPPEKFPPLLYTEPSWGGTAPSVPYALEILKNGAIVDNVPLTHGSYYVIGRLPVCDVSLEHPSISRYHAIIQYRGQAGEEGCVGEERGFYIHDLGSTHGTAVNKNKIPPKTYIRLRVGHVLKFGGSTRLFILQGPEFDEEEESELTVTELRERARKQKEALEKRMMGDNSDEDDDDDEEEEEEEEEEEKEKNEDEESDNKGRGKASSEESGCSWGIAEEEAPDEDENEENPFSTEFQEDQEAAYLKDPKKALQGFYDREGEELEFEFEDKSHGTWLCRIKLPVDDAAGRQLVAEVTHTGKKKEASVQCCLEACRILEARGLLRQEAVSRKRKKKNWEDEDYYDSDDDTFLDRTGTVERKRVERMKKAGKIEERPETYESLVAKLAEVEKELAETLKKLNAGRRDSSGSSTDDPLDAFMSVVSSEAAMDSVERRKLHVHVADLRKDAQRLRRLVELTRPAQMPSLQPGSSEPQKLKKSLPLFGAMKGGSKFKLKTGTIGKLPPKRPNLPPELFNMKGLPPSGEEEEEEEEENAEKDDKERNKECGRTDDSKLESEESAASIAEESAPSGQRRERQPRPQPHQSEEQSHKQRRDELHAEAAQPSIKKAPESKAEGAEDPKAEAGPKKSGKKKAMGPSRPPVQLSAQYPEDDPDYCVWVPPAGQTGDGRTHLNDKYGY